MAKSIAKELIVQGPHFDMYEAISFTLDGNNKELIFSTEDINEFIGAVSRLMERYSRKRSKALEKLNRHYVKEELKLSKETQTKKRKSKKDKKEKSPIDHKKEIKFLNDEEVEGKK